MCIDIKLLLILPNKLNKYFKSSKCEVLLHTFALHKERPYNVFQSKFLSCTYFRFNMKLNITKPKIRTKKNLVIRASQT